MTDALATPSALRRSVWALVTAVVALAAIGVGLRYGAYVSITKAPTPEGFAGAMCVWDCYWYGDIALHGYQAFPENLNFGGPAGIANWAFFPLYPLLIGGLAKLTTLSPPVLGAIVSPLLTLAAVFCAWPLFAPPPARADAAFTAPLPDASAGDRRAYVLFATLLLAGPFSFYFGTLYSESLFLLLTVLAFVALRRRNYLAAGAVGALLSATRTVGVLFVVALVTEVVMDLGRKALRDLPVRPDIVLGIVLVPFGLFAFMGWLYLTTGDALAFVHIQRGWDRQFINPALALWNALSSPEGQTRDAPLLASAGLAGLALCGALVWNRQFAAAAFCTLALVLSLANGVESMLRFVVALAPIGVQLCQLLARRRWLFWVSLVAFLALDFEWTIGWLHQRGALM